MAKAETQLIIQSVMLNNHMFHKMACSDHSSSLERGFAL